LCKEIEDHRLINRSSHQPFAELLAWHVFRRGVMRGGLGAAASMLGFGDTALVLASSGVQKNTSDTRV
jgi:hypothetical protein